MFSTCWYTNAHLCAADNITQFYILRATFSMKSLSTCNWQVQLQL